MRASRRIVITATMLVLALSACAGPEALRRAEREAARSNWDAAVAYYRDLVEEHPTNVSYRIELDRARFQASQQHESIARRLRAEGDLEQALREYQLAAQLDVGNQVAMTGLRHVQEELAEATGEEPRPTRMDELRRQARELAPELPALQPQTTERFSLDFRNAEVRDVYTTLARVAGLSVLFDAQFQPQATTIQIDDVTFFEALDMITRAQGHFYKALSPSVFVVIPDNPNKRREYGDQLLQTFFLSNASAEALAQRLRTMLEIPFVIDDPELNAITIRAAPEVINLAERVVNVADKARGEVMLNIEILEVNRRLLREYGISLSDYQATQSLAQGDAGISLNSLRFINATDWFVTLPSIRYRLFKETGDFKLVANPDVRLIEGEDASLVIGEEVPIVTTTFNPNQLAGNQVVPIRSTVYRDVGIVLGVNARVHHNDEVTLDLQIEVSSVTGTSTIEDLPIFATRNVSSVLRLRDGETNVLAGLLRDDERRSLRGIPGLSDIPLLRELFADHSAEITQTDVILSITPHILQAPDITLDDIMRTYVGTATAISAGPGAGGAAAAPQPSGGAQIGGAVPTQLTLEQQPEMGVAAEQQAGLANVTLEPGNVTVQVGEEFVLDLQVDGVADLFSADLRISFDAVMLEYANGASGPLLGQDGAQTAFQSLPMAPGSVSAGISRIGILRGISGSGRLMSVAFRALAPGSAVIDISSISLRTSEGAMIPTRLRGARVEIMPVGPRRENRHASR